jgi:tetratricopeptide (TPR) repeat protein
MGKFKECMAIVQKNLELKMKIYGEFSAGTANTMLRKANILRKLGKYEDSRKAYENVLAIDTRLYGEKNIHTAVTLNNLALVLRDQGNL